MAMAHLPMPLLPIYLEEMQSAAADSPPLTLMEMET